MRNLLALVGLAVVLFGGCGWYFQWYTFATRTGPDGKRQILLDVDTKKIADDARQLGEKVGHAADSTAAPATPAPVVVGPTSPWFVGPPAPAKPQPTTPSFTLPPVEVHLPGGPR